MTPPDADHPRGRVGRGEPALHPRRPGGARVAVRFVLDDEGDGGGRVLDGDPHPEASPSGIIGAQPFPARHPSMGGLCGCGPRAGVRRIPHPARDRGVPPTVFGVARAAARDPAAVAASSRDGHEIAGHRWRRPHDRDAPEAVGREHLARAVDTIRRLAGQPSRGWHTGRDGPNTRGSAVEHGGFLYDRDGYADELPHRVRVGGKSHPVVPYTPDTDAMRSAIAGGSPSGERFFAHPRDAFARLHEEGARSPSPALFLDHVFAHPDVRVTRRIAISRHRAATHPAPHMEETAA